MNILARLWYGVTRPLRAAGAEKGAQLCKVCGEEIYNAADLAAANASAKKLGMFLGWKCETCGTRGGFGGES